MKLYHRFKFSFQQQQSGKKWVLSPHLCSGRQLWRHGLCSASLFPDNLVVAAVADRNCLPLHLARGSLAKGTAQKKRGSLCIKLTLLLQTLSVTELMVKVLMQVAGGILVFRYTQTCTHLVLPQLIQYIEDSTSNIFGALKSLKRTWVDPTRLPWSIAQQTCRQERTSRSSQVAEQKA